MKNINQTLNLYDWPEIRDDHKWTGLLMGNGASCAVWQNFSYTSLFDRASSPSNLQYFLSQEEITLFKKYQTHNFERVLEKLSTAWITNQFLGESPNSQIQRKISHHYQNIQNALIAAVRSVHIPG
ncbi:MAG: DUF4917 family protein [Elainellaceae cyanobacterium]